MNSGMVEFRGIQVNSGEFRRGGIPNSVVCCDHSTSKRL